MKKSIFRKGLVVAVIVLFFGNSIVKGDIDKQTFNAGIELLRHSKKPKVGLDRYA